MQSPLFLNLYFPSRENIIIHETDENIYFQQRKVPPLTMASSIHHNCSFEGTENTNRPLFSCSDASSSGTPGAIHPAALSVNVLSCLSKCLNDSLTTPAVLHIPCVKRALQNIYNATCSVMLIVVRFIWTDAPHTCFSCHLFNRKWSN